MAALSYSAASFSFRRFSQLHCFGLNWKQNRIEFLKPHRARGRYLWIIRSVLNNRISSSISDNGATEPARILLERLFAQTQKLEEQIGRDPPSPQVAELGLNLGNLESDLQAALIALKKKEEELQDAERKVSLEYNEISRAKKDLERREEEIAAAKVKQEKLEEELRLANVELASQVTEINDLKICLENRDREISAAQSTLAVKEDEIRKMKVELVKKTEEAEIAESELRSKTKLLDEADKIVQKQELELQQLRRALEKKGEELEIFISMQNSETEKLKAAQGKLGQQTMEWLVAQEELKKLREETSKHIGEANETVEEFGRVKKLLSDVRSELVSSQKALASSRLKMEVQEQLLEKQLAELEEQRRSVLSYMNSLRDAEIEVESERVKLRVAEARYKELERDLSIEKELVNELQKELDKERSSLQQANLEITAIQDELDSKNIAFEEKQILLQAKESELVEARLEIQHLKSEKASLQLIVEEKDLELSDGSKMLEALNQEIAELKGILFDREEELIQAMSTLKEKDEHVQTMEHELKNAKLKFSEAETIVEQIVDLTKEVVLSFNNEGYPQLSQADPSYDRIPPPLLDRSADAFQWDKKRLEAELQFTRETLRGKEMEILAAQRALTVKDEELKLALKKLDDQENEITELKQEIMQDKEDLKQLYALAQERIGEKTVGDLATEKLQLEVAQLEVEAATSALQKITKMSRELLNKAVLSIEADYDIALTEDNSSETLMSAINDNGCAVEVKSEVSRLLTLTEQLVREAGVNGCLGQ